MVDLDRYSEIKLLVLRGEAQHNGVPPAALDKFAAGFIEESLLQKYFPNGEWTPPNQFETDIYSSTPDGVIRMLLPHVRDFYQMGQASLYAGHDGKFNEHRLLHVATVAHDAVQLLENKGEDNHMKVCAAAAGVLHDLGIFNSRPYHHLASAVWLDEYFRIFQKDPGGFALIQEAVIDHNEAYYRAPWYEGKLFEEQVEIARSKSPVSGAVVIADKADISPQRVPKHARNKPAIEGYLHYAANWYMKKNYIGPVDDGRVFMMELNLKPYLSKGEALKYTDLAGPLVDTKQELHHSYTPDYLRVDPTNEMSPVSIDKAWELWWGLYGPQFPGQVNRNSLTAAYAWQQYPEIEAVRFRLTDPYTNTKIEDEFTLHNADVLFSNYALAYGGRYH